MADLDQERADLNALVREAHEAIKDLRIATRELDQQLARADKAREMVATLVNDEIKLMIGAAVDLHLAGFPAELDRMVLELDERINARFDKLVETLIGDTERIAAKFREADARTAVDRVLNKHDVRIEWT